MPVSMPRLRNLVIGDEQIVADECSLSPSLSVINFQPSQSLSRGRLPGNDRVFLAEVAVELDHLRGGVLRAVRLLEKCTSLESAS